MNESPDNPEALVIYNIRGRTWPSHRANLDGQRRWAAVSMANHLKHPDKLARPMCIVRLKALK